MYISKPERYRTADGTQCCRMGRFLILLDTPEDKTIYAIVRTVALRQCGHWMMGSARIQGTTYTVSGAYGNDGLPMRINTLPPDAKRLPDELYRVWANGDGWNSAGSEAEAMIEWANKGFKQ